MLVVFSRSPRSMLRVALWLLAVAAGLAAIGVLLVWVGQDEGILVVALAVLPVPLAVQQCVQARQQAAFRIGLFRDRLVLLADGRERAITWREIDTATLGDTSEWATVAWPRVLLTGRLTLRRRDGFALRFRPTEVGLAPAACRDLVLRCRDEEAARALLPLYDPAVSLSRRPAHTGEAQRPSF